MTLSGLQALGVLAGALFIFWRWCQVDESSPSAGTAGSQGEGGAGTPNPRTACRDCEEVR